ncbi:hypothetical protein D9Q98_009405 [Chlorella vulgaris]|uniref:Uncharacterized protein n=1 Tax=Chlorella vulgaris TaxID=3077 RepID=A0A9D4TPD7_CHLVU|nr:hypothetical protein D9Q98_009405 [Chlorella vulgaris]
MLGQTFRRLAPCSPPSIAAPLQRGAGNKIIRAQYEHRRQPHNVGSLPRAAARRHLTTVQAAAEPFQPERPFHKGVVDAGEPEPGPRILGRFTLSDMHYAVNVVYWSLLLVSVLTGNELISRLVHFEVYSTLMFAASALFTLYHSVRFATDLRRHMKTEARRDWRLVLRYLWNAVFWLGFVLWYAVPPASGVPDYTGAPGVVMCLFGAVLAAGATLQAGMFSFMGAPHVPGRLHTGGVYALLRHPQALGNMLFLIGFSVAGGALWACAAFCAAFALYVATVVPQEERMLREAFGEKYERYMQRTPAFAWGLVLLLIVEVVLMTRFQPWANPH